MIEEAGRQVFFSSVDAIDHLSSGIPIPQRNRVEITNYQTQATIGVGDLNEAEHYLLAGMQGATVLGSELKRGPQSVAT